MTSINKLSQNGNFYNQIDKINEIVDGINNLNILSQVYPVGSIYTNTVTAANPASYFGFGTWVAYAQGQVLVGINSGDPTFSTVGNSGGEKTHALTATELPGYNTTFTTIYKAVQRGSADTAVLAAQDGNFHPDNSTAVVTGTATPNIAVGPSHNNLQPYIVVYIWRRTA